MTPAAAAIRRYREDERGILQFVNERFHANPDPWQEEALLAFASKRPEHRRLSLQACVGPGKSTVLAWGGWWFLACQGERGEHPNGACTSITGDNLRDNLWKEFAKWQAVDPFLSTCFTITASRIFNNDHEATWFLSARAFPKTADAEQLGKTLSGLHGKYVLVLIDESGGIAAALLRSAEQALAQGASGFGKIAQAGNPTSLEGCLAAAAVTLRHQWCVIRITGDPDDPRAWVHAPRVATPAVPGAETPADWARQQIATYGRDNPWVMSQILGKFPPASINSLVGVDAVEEAMRRHLRSDQYDWAQKRLGVDVARFGDDRSVIFPRQGLAAFKPAILRNERTTAIAARVAMAIRRWGAETTYVDDTGHWGHGVIDNLLTAGLPTFPVVFSDKALDPRYKNRRAEMWLVMAEWVKGGGALPPIPELVAELTTPTYTFLGGQFVLEEKDQIKKRLGRSPDLADALALTFAMPDMPADVLRRLQPQATALRDADPFGQGQAVARDGDPFS